MSQHDDLSRRHLLFGWWSLLVFLLLGIFLEVCLAFKLDLYLNMDNDVRRLMWRLAHAHGGLIALVHLAFAFTLRWISDPVVFGIRLASAMLMATTILLPGGFFLGGFGIQESDPGIGVFLAPLGAMSFFVAVVMIVRTITGAFGERR